MNNRITTATAYVLRLLSHYKYGTVHSVYRKTINLSVGGQLAALQASGSPLSPISLLTTLTSKEMAELPIKVQDSVTISSGILQIGKDCRFLLDDASSMNLELSFSLSSEKLSVLERLIFPIFSFRDAGSFELLFCHPEKAAEIPFLAAAQKYLLHTSQALFSSDWETAAQALCRLIGLGPGLTPGGDDFLCGVLAGLILCGNDRHPFTTILRRTIAGLLSNTNQISAAFLQCALEKQFSLAICSLTALPSSEEILANFLKIGHSSGTDTLCGIAYVLQNRHFLR